MPINNIAMIGSLVLNILVLIVGIAGFIKITANDLRHLSIDVKAIRDSQEKEEARLEKIEIAQATMKAVCDERSSMYKLNKKIGAIRNRKS